jgi:hypothetical protein
VSKRNRLTKLRINEVSVVDSPANVQAEILIAKRHDGGADRSQNPHMEDHVMTLEELTKKLEAAEAAVATLTKRAEDAEANAATLTKRADEAEAEVKKAKEAASAAEDGEDPILKSLDPSVRAYIEGIKKDADEAKDAVAKAADARVTAEYVTKAATFTGLPGVTGESFGPVLKRVLGGATDEDQAAVLDVLTKASDAVKKSLTKPIGEAGRVEKSDAEAEMDAKAHEIAKRDGTTFALAYRKALNDNPDLYTRMINKD